MSVVALGVILPWLKRLDPDEHERTTFPSVAGRGQPEGMFGWIPPILLAPVVGVIAQQVKRRTTRGVVRLR